MAFDPPQTGEAAMVNRFDNSGTFSVEQAQTQAGTIFLAKVFNWMAIGLGLTAVTAFLVANVPALRQMILGNQLVFFGLIIGELGLVFYLSARVAKMTAGAATGVFMAYSVLNGATLSAVLLAYTGTSIVSTFVVAGGMFGAMAVYGFVTKKDLSSWGSFLFMGLIGIVIAMVVNIFMASSMLAWMISGIGVIVFTGLTAYDVQQITRMGAGGIMDGGEAAIRKGAIIGALKLYLDFINLFLMLLHFLGDRR
jgi:uncharacterized protein